MEINKILMKVYLFCCCLFRKTTDKQTEITTDGKFSKTVMTFHKSNSKK